MREIKFRGKVKQSWNYKQGEWVYGGISFHKDGFTYICPERFSDYNEEIEVIPESVGQFTGLTDKNGKEIYEGDIVATKPNDKIITVGDIQFHCGVFGAEWRHAKKDKTMVGSWGQRHNLRRLDDDIIDDIEVIGNIYDNPELIKE